MLNSHAPFRKPPFEFSKAALVINLKAEVRAPATPRPAMYDYKEARRCIPSKLCLIETEILSYVPNVKKL